MTLVHAKVHILELECIESWNTKLASQASCTVECINLCMHG